MELESKVQTYRIDKKCDKCKDGLMFATGEGFTTWHSEWEHKCNKCGEVVWFKNKKYPFGMTKDIGKPKIKKIIRTFKD